MFVCVYSVFVLFCVQVAALRQADPQSKESYRLCIGLRNWKIGQGPKGCRAIEKYISLKINVDYQRTTRRYIPEHRTLRNHRCENLKPYK
jgi:hypothetical protein